MPIETICSGCGKKLRVADEHAGKKARCPDCGNIYLVPHGDAETTDQPVDQSTPAASDGAAGSSAGPDPRLAETRAWQKPASSVDWELRIEDGRVFGPVSKAELDDWAAEGRIAPDAGLRRAGDQDWQPATTLYPYLATASQLPQKEAQYVQPVHYETPNPYSSPAPTPTPLTSSRPFIKPHRGGMILTFGILGIVCCGIMGVIAWVMAHGDLQEIRSGRMDPSGEGLTKAGRVLGIIGTILWIIGVAGNQIN